MNMEGKDHARDFKMQEANGLTNGFNSLDVVSPSPSLSQEEYRHSSLSDARKDVGTLKVLESKGTWLHAGYHLTTAIAAPSLLSLPYAFSFLGWAPGLLAITICGLVSSYAYCLLSQVLDDCASKGHRFSIVSVNSPNL
ncbi:unnamed protein product [Sphagnum balticum]